ARVGSQALPLDDERSEALDDLDGRAEDTRRERGRREAVLRGARSGAARGEEDVREGRSALVLPRDLDAPDVGRALRHDARGQRARIVSGSSKPSEVIAYS